MAELHQIKREIKQEIKREVKEEPLDDEQQNYQVVFGGVKHEFDPNLVIKQEPLDMDEFDPNIVIKQEPLDVDEWESGDSDIKPKIVLINPHTILGAFNGPSTYPEYPRLNSNKKRPMVEIHADFLTDECQSPPIKIAKLKEAPPSKRPKTSLRCDACNKIFISLKGLLIHTADCQPASNKSTKIERKEKTPRCTACKKIFISSKGLFIHTSEWCKMSELSGLQGRGYKRVNQRKRMSI